MRAPSSPSGPWTEPVTTTAGAVRGVWRDLPGGAARSAAFLGIPFARPPVGDLRFAAPVPPEPWSGVRDTAAHGATAQRWMPPEPTLIPEPSIPGPSTLNVDVYSPDPRDGALLPVLVWIHGGGYVSGSPASPWYDGRAFTRDGVVTVTVSYRLGFDGFGWIDGAPPNRAVLDWLAALEWVRDNVRAFGGDPGEVTVAGQSAGGGAVLTLLGLPAGAGLFHRAIAISPALADIPVARARATAARLAAILGVEPTRAGFASAPERSIERHQVPAARDPAVRGVAALRAALTEPVPYGPVIDGTIVPRPAIDALADGAGAGIPLVVGATDDEFSWLTERHRGALRAVPPALALRLLGLPYGTARRYRRANRDIRGTAAVVGRYVTDHVFRTVVVRVAKARGAAPTWAYRFSWRSPTRGLALHCLDVPFWFDCLDAERVEAIAGDTPPQRLADELHGAAVAFARDGDPGWRAWSTAPGATRVFGGTGPTVDADGYRSVRPLL